MTLLGIALPSLLLVAALRRWIRPVPWRIAGLFLALTLVFLHGAVFTSKLPVPVDDAVRAYPGRGVVGEVSARNDTTSDTAKQFLPWMQVAREELGHFRAPLWNRFSFSGYPLLANGQSAPFSPLFLSTLFVRLPKQIVAMAGLKIFAALLFTYIFVRREGAGDAAAIFAAIVFGWSTALTVFLYYSAGSVMAFLPAAAFALLHAMDEPRKRGVVFVALVIGTLMANGHPESVLHAAIGCGGLLLIDLGFAADRRDWLRRFRAPLAGVVAGLAISAPAWVPVLEQTLLSTRLAALRAGYPFGFMPPTAAWALVMANGFGNPVRHNYSWWVGYAGVAASYAGLLALVLFAASLIAPRTSPRDRILGCFAVVLFLAATNWTPIGHLVNALPPFSVAANDKLRFVALFFVAVLAAKALDTPKRWIATAALPAVALALYVYWDKRALLQPADLLGVAGVVAFFFVPRKWAALLIGAELFALNAGFNALVDRRYFRPRVPIVGAIRARAPQEPFRVAGLDYTFAANASAQVELEDIRGSDPMAFASYDAYFAGRKTVDGDAARRLEDAGRPELDFLNVRYLLTDPDVHLAGRWIEVYRGADGALFENRSVLPRFFSRTAAVESIRALAPGEFTMLVTASAASAVVSSEVAAPGRRVSVGGRRAPIRLVEGAFIGFDVPAGTSEVRVTYCPVSYWGSVALAGLTVLLLAVRNRGIASG